MSWKNWAVVRFCRWVYRILDKQIILIDYNVDVSRRRYNEVFKFARMSSAQAISMGYIRGKNIKDEIAYIPFKIYVRFTPSAAPPDPFTTYEDGTIVPNLETSSTLWDHWRSDAIEKFLAGMTTRKTLAPIDQKKLLMIGVVIVGALAGLYILFR